tara:strand:+ start:203 stop:451 length:249 start_codon:yes stop_codon:yes gene_type:complete
MHYIAILTFVGFVTFATGGHSQTFGKAYDAVMRGDVDSAVNLFTKALRSTLQDADSGRDDCDSKAKIVLIPTIDSTPSVRCS